MSMLISCDRQGAFARAAVWQGKVLHALYVDSADAPDMTGAVVGARVARVLAGEKKAWLDAGLAEKLYLESKQPLKTGQCLTVQILSTMPEGKAWPARLVSVEDKVPLGVITPPPPAWLRALQDCGKDNATRLLFQERADHAQFQASGLSGQGTLHTKEPVHPQLDELIDGLLAPQVPLAGGAALIIESTAALVAIDVNAEMAKNPTATNLLAVREAARQIKLRNLGGIIVMDCLKMASRADASKIVHAFERVAHSDPAGVQCYGINKLGLLDCVRTRRGPSLREVMGDA